MADARAALVALLDPPAVVAPEVDVAVADRWILAADVEAPDAPVDTQTAAPVGAAVRRVAVVLVAVAL